ncbi:MAG: hypothetical protein WC683_06330 [bacterium]
MIVFESYGHVMTCADPKHDVRPGKGRTRYQSAVRYWRHLTARIEELEQLRGELETLLGGGDRARPK